MKALMVPAHPPNGPMLDPSRNLRAFTCFHDGSQPRGELWAKKPTLTLDNARLSVLEDTLFQADFCLSQALACRTDVSRQAILRITQETVRKALSSGVPV
jgi:hypothetical protein